MKFFWKYVIVHNYVFLKKNLADTFFIPEDMQEIFFLTWPLGIFISTNKSLVRNCS